jgi:hypothetical protein
MPFANILFPDDPPDPFSPSKAPPWNWKMTSPALLAEARVDFHDSKGD